MNDTINGRTPEEIKLGLECCTVEYCYHTQKGCPYRDYSLCVQNVCADALAYIQQLERERDAALADLARYAKCVDCMRYDEVIKNNQTCDGCENGSNWQWCGVQEVE